MREAPTPPPAAALVSQALCQGLPAADVEWMERVLQWSTSNVPVELTAGKHVVAVRTTYSGVGRGVFARFLDPDRKLSYFDAGVKK